MQLRIAERARSDIRAAASWWRANRPLAPLLLDNELERAFALIETQPEAGPPALDVAMAGVRRVSLHRTRYLLYYRLRPEQNVIEILRLWHASRGAAPKL